MLRWKVAVVVMVMRGRTCDGVGFGGWESMGQAGSRSSIWPHPPCCVGVPRRVFPPKCPFDTRFHAPLAKVIHPVAHLAYRLSKVSATPPNVSPLLRIPLVSVSPGLSNGFAYRRHGCIGFQIKMISSLLDYSPVVWNYHLGHKCSMGIFSPNIGLHGSSKHLPVN
jgi:hypothetical protein